LPQRPLLSRNVQRAESLLKSLARNQWLLADQVLVSGMNFTTTVLLARMLGVYNFGIFTVLYYILLYVNSIQLALNVQPMFSIAPQMPEGPERQSFLRGMAGYQYILSALFCLLILLAGLLEKLKNDPNNTGLLDQVGAVYHATHQFKEAAAYYDKAVQIDPKNVALRTKLAISLYRSGDVDGAIAQLNRSLSYDPKDANSLFDLGMIKLQGKQDSKGALAAWQQLLKTNPQLSADRKATVQKLMASVQTAAGDQHGVEGAQSK